MRDGFPTAAAERVLATVAAAPGSSTSAIGRALGYRDWTTPDYHLRKLAQVGKVRSERVGRERRWYVVGAPATPAPAAAQAAAEGA